MGCPILHIMLGHDTEKERRRCHVRHCERSEAIQRARSAPNKKARYQSRIQLIFLRACRRGWIASLRSQ
jgi:hypothetical protein